MRFIEIRDGFSINSRAIETIEKSGEFKTKIQATTGNYTTNIPYDTFIKLLELEKFEEHGPVLQALKNLNGHLQQVGQQVP